MTSTTLRAGQPGDRDFVGALAGEAFGALGRYDQVVPGWLANPGVQTIVAVHTARPIGFVMVRVRKTLGGLGPAVGELLAIAVVAGERNHGVGRALLQAAETRVRQSAGAMVLNTAADNLSAQRFFRAMGFEALRTRRRFYPGGQAAIDMRKALARRALT
jgi:ribosomal protein S18 acetylase RimI-like enzyme